MTKDLFMQLLAKGLYSLPVTEREEILADYHEHFAQGLAEGRSEAQIVEHLGDPADIAREYVEAWQEKNGSPGAQEHSAGEDAHRHTQQQESAGSGGPQYRTSPNTPPFYDRPADGHARHETAFTAPIVDNGPQLVMAIIILVLGVLILFPVFFGVFSAALGIFIGGIGALVSGFAVIFVSWLGPITIFVMIFLFCLGGLMMIAGYVLMKYMILCIVWLCRSVYSLMRFGRWPRFRSANYYQREGRV